VSPTVLRGVTVVDTRDGSLTPGVDLTLDGGRIAAIRPAAPDAPPSDTAGKYVVPGYLDMHAHPFELKDPAGTLELMLSYGVTGFRQMSGSPKMLRQRAAGTLPMPADSPAVVARPGTDLSPLNAGTERAAVATVAEQHAAGADFIKVGFVPPDVLYAAQAEARALGIPILGHLPVNIDVVRASRGGLRSIEHLGPGLGILAACSADEDGIRATLSAQKPVRIPSAKLPFMDRIVAAMIRRMAVNPTKLAKSADLVLTQHAVDTFDEARARGLAARFVADGTWQCPTLIRKRTTQLCDAPEYRADPDLRYVADATVKLWNANASKFAARPASERATFRAEYALQLRVTKLFDDAGVKMIAGSDACGAVWEVAGHSLHQEFDELAAAGLSPLRILQMTTLDAAEFLGAAATMGTVEVGKDADLVLLDANPADDVKHLHQVSGVVRAGRHYTPADLKAIRSRVAAARPVG
jgi:imidazolonepropionase-like amidohydrolase